MHFLLLLTPSALEHCDDPSDWLRREIETALATQRNIVPLMLEGFDVGTPKIASSLTGMLAVLKRYNGLPVYPQYFEEAMERLRARYLNIPLNTVLHPASLVAQKAAAEQKAEADESPAVQEGDLTAEQSFERGFNATDIEEKWHSYDEAIRLKSAYGEAFSNRGAVRFENGDLDEALQDYAEAVRLKPDAKVFYNRGLARRYKGDSDGAIRDYTEAIRLKPDYARAFYNRGLAHYSKGDLESAIQDYKKVIRLRPDDADAFTNRGAARYDKGELAGAIDDYSQALRLNPESAIAFHNRGIARRDKGDLDAAAHDFKQAARLKGIGP